MEVTVTGAGGLIGSAMVDRLLKAGHHVRAVDLKNWDDWYGGVPSDDSHEGVDLRYRDACDFACQGAEWVFQFAADMGGVYFLENNRADCMRTALITINMLDAAVMADVQRLFYSSSACAYNIDLQQDADSPALKEEDAWPARPEPAYGDEKLFGEVAAHWWRNDYGLETRVARYHNIYGIGTWEGPRAKAPAGLCAKVAKAVVTSEHRIEIWGDGEQARSFCHIDDCLEGTVRLMASDHTEPLNVGSSEMVTINEMVTMIEDIADVKLEREYDLTAPQGVRGRSSDNTRIREVLGWEPSVSLYDGLSRLYPWVYDRVKEQHGG